MLNGLSLPGTSGPPPLYFTLLYLVTTFSEQSQILQLMVSYLIFSAPLPWVYLPSNPSDLRMWLSVSDFAK